MSGVGLDTDYMLNTVYKTAYVLGNTTVPFEGHIAKGWNYMTDNYSEFTIATIFSVILHEVHILIVLKASSVRLYNDSC